MNSDVSGIVDNITIINLKSNVGPVFALLDVKTVLSISNVLFQFDSNYANQPQIAMFWSANVSLSNFTVIGPSGMGVFYIQYQSKVWLENVKISNFSCCNPEKGCIISGLSNSTIYLSNISLESIKSISSLIHIDNSSLLAQNLFFNSILINGSEAYAFSCELASLQLNNTNSTFFLGGFLQADQSLIRIKALNLKNNIFKEGFTPSAMSLSQILTLIISDSNFENIETDSNGGVRKNNSFYFYYYFF